MGNFLRFLRPSPPPFSPFLRHPLKMNRLMMKTLTSWKPHGPTTMSHRALMTNISFGNGKLARSVAAVDLTKTQLISQANFGYFDSAESPAKTFIKQNRKKYAKRIAESLSC